MNIHPTAVVESGARLGNGVKVGAFCYIQAESEIGDGCQLGSHVSILEYTTLGRNCHVHAGAVLGGLPQDTGFKDGVSFAKIGDDCIIRENVTINRGTKPETQTTVGDRCMLMANCHVAHNVQMGSDVIVANCTALAGYVTVGARAFISGNVGVHQFCRVGTMAMVGICAVITKDLPPFCTVRPSSENGVGGLNVVGMRRAGLSADERATVKSAFKILYLSGLNVTQAVAEIEKRGCTPAVQTLLDFIQSSKRGICSSTIHLRSPLAK